MIEPTTQNMERAVRGFVAAGSGLESRRVRPGNSDGPAPNELYATVLLIHQAIDGIPETPLRLSAEGERLDAETHANVRSRYSVQWFRPGAHDAAKRLSVWASSPTGRDLASSLGLTFIRVSDIRQLDDIVSNAWEERAGLDLDLGYIQTLAQTVDYFRDTPVAISST